jgi:hypothetical protein
MVVTSGMLAAIGRTHMFRMRAVVPRSPLPWHGVHAAVPTDAA